MTENEICTDEPDVLADHAERGKDGECLIHGMQFEAVSRQSAEEDTGTEPDDGWSEGFGEGV